MGAMFCIVVAVGCGWFSSLLPGLCNLTIVDAALRGAPQRRTTAMALGGALGDLTYAVFAATGAHLLLAHHPELPVVLQAIAGIVLISIGGMQLARPPAMPVASWVGGGGLRLGLALVLANPSALLTWTFVIASAARAQSGACRGAMAVAIAAGSFAGFWSVAHTARRGATWGVARRGTAIWVILIVVGVVSLVRAVGAMRTLA